MLQRKQSIFYCLICLLSYLSSCQKEKINGNLDYKTLGTSANSFLSEKNYTSVNVQISYMPGNEPPDSSIEYFRQFLNMYLNKTDGISIFTKPVSASGKNMLTLKEIVAIENNNRIAFTSGNQIAVHILINDANYTTADIFATSYWNTSFVIFGKTVNQFSGAAGQISTSRLTTLLLCHEMGHLLGLVNQGTPMATNHRDASNVAHCNNLNCLMNFGIETSQITGNPSSGNIPLMDANCHNDLIANGGK